MSEQRPVPPAAGAAPPPGPPPAADVPAGKAAPARGKGAKAARKPGAAAGAAPGRGKRETAAELRLELAERDRRLAELTEHSLQILDRLAAAREELRERNSLVARIRELQEMLAQTRQRIRVAGRAVLGPEPAEAPWETAAWGFGQGDAGAFADLLAAAPQAACTLLLGPGVAAPPFAQKHEGALVVLDTVCRTPAHFWNQAMAATQAEVVVFLTADVRPTPAALERLAAVTAAEGVAIASPCLVSAQSRTLGRDDRGLLELLPRAAGDGKDVEPVPFASPEAFALSRSAYEQLGPFDQDLRGDLALAEWCLRAAARTLRCVGVVDAEFAAHRVRHDSPENVGADRIVILARHRPHQLAAAVLGAEALWRKPPEEVGSVLRAAFRRLPHAVELAPAIDLLAAQAQTVADFAQVRAGVTAQLAALAGPLGVQPGGPLTEVVDRVRGAAMALQQQLAAAQQQLERQAALVGGLQQQLQAREQAEAQLQAEQQQRAAELQALRQQLQSSTETIARIEREQSERERVIAELRQDVVRRRTELEHVQERFSGALRDVTGLVGIRDTATGRITALERELAGATERYNAAVAEVDAVRSGHEELRQEHGTLQEQYVELASRVHELVLTLRDREHWIVLLLEEVQRRRWKRRPLSQHEQDFLARHGVGERP